MGSHPGRVAAALLVSSLAAAPLSAAWLEDTPAWTSPDPGEDTALGWGDLDGDGLLDLAIATAAGAPLRVYRNTGGGLALAFTSTETDDSFALAWGDVDRDGDLDLAVGNRGPDRLYRNDGGTLVLAWTGAEPDDTRGLAFGDFDGDHDLDLAAGNRGGPNRLYRNDAGTLTLHWTSPESDDTEAVAFGRWDGDALPDLAVGNDGQPNRVYRSTGVDLQLAWTAPAARSTRALAWADLDGDADLDLVSGNDGAPGEVWLSDAGTLVFGWELAEDAARCIAVDPRGGDLPFSVAIGTAAGRPLTLFQRGQTPGFTTSRTDSTRACAWGDLDGDQDPDLAVANDGGAPSLVYRDPSLIQNGSWASSTAFHGGRALGLADLDCDGDLDLVAAGDYLPIASPTAPLPLEVWENVGGNTVFRLAWSSAELLFGYAVSIGDFDSDADLDLAAADNRGPKRVYRNDGGLAFSLAWSSPEVNQTRDVAWADADQDGDLDLAAASYQEPLQLYLNDGGGGLALAWSSPVPHNATALDWGDFDGDGDLDLAVATLREANHIYRNDGGTPVLGWSTTETDDSRDARFADWDGDGLLDLAVANIGPDRLYRNDGTGLALAFTAPQAMSSLALDWADHDGDGDLDLAVGDGSGYHVWRNDRGSLALAIQRDLWYPHESVAWGDVDDDGDLELVTTTRNDHGSTLHLFRPTPARPMSGLPEVPTFPLIATRPGATPAGPAFSAAERTGSPVLVPYVLVDPDGDRVARIRAEYSILGGGRWLPATPAPGGEGTTDLATSPSGAPHVFAWDAAADAVDSDAVVFRIAVPVQAPSRVGGPLALGVQSAVSAPFRVSTGSPGRGLIALESVSPAGPAHAGEVVTFRIELRNTGSLPLTGVDVVDSVDDPNLDEPGALGNLVCPPPGIGSIDTGGPHPVVRCLGLDVPAGASVEVTFEATIDDPYAALAGVNAEPVQRVCNAAGVLLAGRCATTPPVCVEVVPRLPLPRFTERPDGFDDTDLDGRLDPGEGIWYRLDICQPADSDAGAVGFLLRQVLAAETTREFDRLMVSEGLVADQGDRFEVAGIQLEPSLDPALACAWAVFRTRVGAVARGTTVCHQASIEWQAGSGNPRRTWSNGDLPGAPSACFTVDGGCDPALLPVASGLTAVRAAGGLELAWSADPGVRVWHVNSVSRALDLAAGGTRRSPAGVGLAQCESPGDTPTCVDPDAFTDGSTLSFYSVHAACGPGGAEEGP